MISQARSYVFKQIQFLNATRSSYWTLPGPRLFPLPIGLLSQRVTVSIFRVLSTFAEGWRRGRIQIVACCLRYFWKVEVRTRCVRNWVSVETISEFSCIAFGNPSKSQSNRFLHSGLRDSLITIIAAAIGKLTADHGPERLVGE